MVDYFQLAIEVTIVHNELYTATVQEITYQYSPDAPITDWLYQFLEQEKHSGTKTNTNNTSPGS